MFFKKKPLIEVSALDTNIKYFTKPDQSKNFFPDWLKKVKLNLPDEHQGEKLYKSQTVRGCMPFLDAITMGWILPMPWDVYFKVSDYGKEVNYEYRNKIKLQKGIINPPIENHNQFQAGMNNLYADAPILKFINPWKITTRPGYSTMFINPVNRGKSYIEVFSGVVDTDKYNSHVNLPFRVLNPDNKEEYDFTIKAGYPLAQFFPVNRKESWGELPVRIQTEQDEGDTLPVQSNWHWYKEKIHQKKD